MRNSLEQARMQQARMQQARFRISRLDRIAKRESDSEIADAMRNTVSRLVDKLENGLDTYSK
jgi:hypothetical protein